MNLRTKLLADYYFGGAIHIVLKPFVILLGKILRRNHSLESIDELVIIKLLGGGGLVIAYPSLLALKKANPALHLALVTTPEVKTFAELTGLFEEIIIIRDNNVLNLALDSIKAIRRLWRVRLLVDLEIHSRLSSIFCLLTCAINRIGVYTDLSFGRKALYTHLLFYNKSSPIYSLYDQVVQLLGVKTIDYPSAKDNFNAHIKRYPSVKTNPEKLNIGVAPGCSPLGRERRLTEDQWIDVLSGLLAKTPTLDLYFIGGRQDTEFSQRIISTLQVLFPKTEFHNCCGRYSLSESVKLISQLKTLYCIDSGPIHFARLLGVKTISFWGPTDPESRLRPDSRLAEDVNYVKLTCSPCIHVAFAAPCYGNNICMKASLNSQSFTGDRNPLWLAKE
jgi:ADP-heptose:LPS heptosyltransferase